MPIRDKTRSALGREIGARTTARIARELRDARRSAGLSQEAAGEAAGMSHAQVSRIERAHLEHATVDQLARLAAALGLDLVVRTYPAGDPVRDKAQLQLLERFRQRIASAWRWRTEVPMPIPGDRRAWDAVISNSRSTIGIEAETVLDYIQALQRRISLKRRDGPLDRVVLLVGRTARNRAVIEDPGSALREVFPIPQRPLMVALAEGSDPGGNGIVVL